MLTVNDLMTVRPRTVSPDATLREIMMAMKQEGCRQLPVVSSGRLVGIITDRDVRLVMNSPILWHDPAQDEELLDTVTAEGIMTTTPITVLPDTPAYRAAEMLCVYKFGALPVLEDGRLVGIITVTDFLSHLTARHPNEIIAPG